MKPIKSIAVTGKGGTGKTIVSSLMISLLSKRFPGKVLAIDADSAMSLPYTLGLSVHQTVSQVRKEMMGLQEVRRSVTDPAKEMMRKALTHGDGFDLLTMGRPEEPGCFCAVNELLRFGIETLMNDYTVCIIDGEAGPEQLNRRVLSQIDVLFVVSDMSARSLATAGGIIDIAKNSQGGIRVGQAGLILNRVRDDVPAPSFLKQANLEITGSLPEDELLNSFDREGRSLLELPPDSACPKAVGEILNRLLPQA